MEKLGFPKEGMKEIRDAMDCNLYFFEKPVSLGAMYTVLVGAIVVLVALYIVLNIISKRRDNQ